MFQNLSIRAITKSECAKLLNEYHYLSKESKGFRCGFNYGIFKQDELISVCIFHAPSVPELVKGCFGLDRSSQEGIYELGRLCVHPEHNFKNLLSWFVSKSIKLLKKETVLKAVISYADSKLHNGFIYQATNFSYYGLTDKKKDFWFELDDGTFIKHSRGPVKNKRGEWRDRTRKHRYMLVFDKTLKTKWIKQPYPKNKNVAPLNKKTP